MRALTVRQPWAWAIVHGGKDVENRSRNIAGGYRGPLAIHAGKTLDVAAFEDPLIEAATIDASYFLDLDDDRDPYPLGAFIGVADLVDVHWGEQPGAIVTPWADWCCHPWGQSGRFAHLVLANPRPLPEPIPARGMLGLWTPPPVVLEQLQAVAR
jgi:hypothetical protein